MKPFTIKTALEAAIRAEELGIKFYSDLAIVYHANTELKETLELLAKDEVEHKRQFNELLRQITNDNKPNEEASDFLACVDITRFFDDMLIIDKSVNILDILKKAYEFEKETVLFYSGIKDMLGAYPQMEEIIQIEKKHAARLYQHITTDGKFHSLSEKS